MATLFSTIIDPGGTGNYLSLNAAEAAHFGTSGANFVSNNEYAECEGRCTNGAADTAYAVLAGQTCDATRNYTVFSTGTYKHANTWPSSGNKYRLSRTGGNNVYMGAAYITLRGLAVAPNPTGNGQIGIQTNGGNYGTIEDCVVTVLNTTHFALTGVQILGINPEFYVINSIIYGWSKAGYNGLQVNSSAANAVRLYDNTVVYNANGVLRTNGLVIAKGNIAFGNTTDWSGIFAAGTTVNGYTNGQAGPSGGTAAVDLGSDGTAIFTNVGSDIYTLKDTNSPAFQVGLDLSSDSPAVTDDIDDETRRVAGPCLGADELLTTTTTTTTTSTTTAPPPVSGDPPNRIGGTASKRNRRHLVFRWRYERHWKRIR